MSVSEELLSELQAICGTEHVPTHRHQLRTYESDGLLQYAQIPGAVVLPGTGEEVRRVVAACHRSRHAVRGAWLGVGPVRRRDAGQGRRGDRAFALAPHPRGRSATTSAWWSSRG
ncbi:MAG: hypothetical protein WKF40_00845 [Thermoleophilaceae bacterium]